MTNANQSHQAASVDAKSEPPERVPRPRRKGRYALYALGVLLLAYLVFYLVASLQLHREMARLRADHVPMTYAQAAPAIPDSENAAVLYLQPCRRLKNRADLRAVLDAANELITAKPQETARALAKLEQLLARHERDLGLVKAASLRPRCRFWMGPGDPVVGSDYFPRLPGARAATNFLTAKALVEARRRRMQQALDDCATVIRISNHLGQEPTLIAQLVRFSCLTRLSRCVPRVIAEGAASTEDLRRFHDLIREVDVMRPFLNALPLERSRPLRMFQDPARKEMARLFESLLAPTAPESWIVETRGRWRVWLTARALGDWWPVTRVVWAPFIKLDEVHRLRETRDAALLARRPYRESREDWGLGQPIWRGVKWYMIVPYSETPVCARAAVLRDKTSAGLGLVQAAVALKAYQVEHGRYPTSLAELSAAGGWAIPDDPFSGKPFRYRREGAGYLVYSVGDDLVDDGGVTIDEASTRWARSHPRVPHPERLTYDLPLRIKR